MKNKINYISMITKRLFLIAGLLLILFACEENTKPKYNVAKPSFNPGAGVYSSPQTIQINCATAGATIRYTLDGTDPNSKSAIYSVPLTISSNTEIRARGYKSKLNPSEIASGLFTFNVARLFIYPNGGTFVAPHKVGIIATSPNTAIHYTTDGSDPTESSPAYRDSLLLQENTLLKVRGYIAGWTPSEIDSAYFQFKVSPPTVNYNPGIYYNPITLAMSTPTPDALIYYTTDGSEPTEDSNLYTDPLELNSSTTFKIKAFRQNWTPSTTVSANYSLKVSSVNFSPGPGTYNEAQSIKLTTNTPAAKIYYTLNGQEPTQDSNLYTAPISLSTNTTLKAKAYKSGWIESNISTGAYYFKVATPVFEPPSGSYGEPQKVSISCATPEAVIRYTTNNTDPTAASSIYTTPLNITCSTTVKAKAFRLGWTDSQIATAYYQITNTVAAPTFSPNPSVIYPGPIEVKMACDTPGASIYYTLDGSDPTQDANLYSAPVLLTEYTVVKAKAYKPGWNPSPIVSATYQITNTVETPTFEPDPSMAYNGPTAITIECATPNATIYYTTDGTDPTEKSSLYSGPFTLVSSATVKARAYKLGWTPSNIASAFYQISSEDYQIVAWGLNNDSGQCNVPIGTGFIQIDCGKAHTVALRANGSLAAWGNNEHQQCNFPTGETFVAVSAGDYHTIALTADNHIVAWGDNSEGQCNVPDLPGVTYQAISAGGMHSLALTSDNQLVAWGNNNDGQCNVPSGNNFIKISAGQNFNMALRSTGGIVVWGNNDSGQLNAPTTTIFTDIAAGSQHCLAKKNDGTLLAWGNNGNGQANVPAGNNFQTIVAGYRHNLALRLDGTIITWGFNGEGLSEVPTGYTYIDVSAGEDFSVALKAPARIRKNSSPQSQQPKNKHK